MARAKSKQSKKGEAKWKPGSVHDGIAAVSVDELIERKYYEGDGPVFCHNCFYAKPDGDPCPRCGHCSIEPNNADRMAALLRASENLKAYQRPCKG